MRIKNRRKSKELDALKMEMYGADKAMIDRQVMHNEKWFYAEIPWILESFYYTTGSGPLNYP